MRSSVLIVDDNEDISQIVGEVLSNEGFLVSTLAWTNAAWMRDRSRPIPVIMFTAHTSELAEARMGLSERSKKAAFVGFLSKPFDLGVLVETVARVVDEPAAVRELLPR